MDQCLTVKIKILKIFKKFLKSLKPNLTLKIKVKVFELVRDIYVIKWFKFEDKIQNTSKVIVFTRNHTDDNSDDDDGTKTNMGGGGETKLYHKF